MLNIKRVSFQRLKNGLGACQELLKYYQSKKKEDIACPFCEDVDSCYNGCPWTWFTDGCCTSYFFSWQESRRAMRHASVVAVRVAKYAPWVKHRIPQLRSWIRHIQTEIRRRTK